MSRKKKSKYTAQVTVRQTSKENHLTYPYSLLRMTLILGLDIKPLTQRDPLLFALFPLVEITNEKPIPSSSFPWRDK